MPFHPERTPRILSRTVLARGRWLRLEELHYRDHAGTERRWERAGREGGRRAACIIARTVPSNRVLLVRQFRPPAGAYVIEFPAGLIDDGESPETAALRELTEETGYHGRVVAVSPAVYNTPGMTDESAFLVEIEIDKTLPENRRPIPAPDTGEFIQVFTVPRDRLFDFLMEQDARGVRIDSKLLAYALAR